MNPTKAKLHGIISPTGQDEGFYVPVFVDPERSNHLLVQIVNEQSHIEAFEPFFTTVAIKPVDFNLVKEIGDSAFWYFKFKGYPLYGDVQTVWSEFQKRKTEALDDPYITLQIMTACKIEGQEPAIKAVRNSLIRNLGIAGANAWLDTNVLSPRIRNWLDKSGRTGRRTDFRFFVSRVLAVTKDARTTILVPEPLRAQIGAAGWRRVTEQLILLLQHFELQFAEVAFLESGMLKSAKPSDLSLLKREAVAAFARSRGLSLRQITKSYFETPTADMRVVCTFSSRYEGKGKRRYWYGYQNIWDRWLEGSSEGFLLLGCKDARLCFALPLDFIRSQLPNLWSTGTGKDKYWHVDIVDFGGDKNLLYVPRLKRTIALSEYSFRF